MRVFQGGVEDVVMAKQEQIARPISGNTAFGWEGA